MGKKQPRKQKHVPQRTCIVCRKKTDKRQLVRIVRTVAGVVVDPTGKQNGRGAYLCDNPMCWQQSIERNMLDKVLKTELDATEKAAILAAKPVVFSAEQPHG